mmetsp:Transcript_136552/g.436206  ORF Transcript_136552/g.436206 Transcript_136552/m.436206 type:complete len:258 (-) Transcript_136552:974-1747(-)
MLVKSAPCTASTIIASRSTSTCSHGIKWPKFTKRSSLPTDFANTSNEPFNTDSSNHCRDVESLLITTSFRRRPLSWMPHAFRARALKDCTEWPSAAQGRHRWAATSKQTVWSRTGSPAWKKLSGKLELFSANSIMKLSIAKIGLRPVFTHCPLSMHSVAAIFVRTISGDPPPPPLRPADSASKLVFPRNKRWSQRASRAVCAMFVRNSPVRKARPRFSVRAAPVWQHCSRPPLPSHQGRPHGHASRANSQRRMSSKP